MRRHPCRIGQYSECVSAAGDSDAAGGKVLYGVCECANSSSILVPSSNCIWANIQFEFLIRFVFDEIVFIKGGILI